METNGEKCSRCSWPVDAECNCPEVTSCARCGREIAHERQLCHARTPASPFCWAEEPEGDTLEIQPGLQIRPGSAPAVPLRDFEGDLYD